MGSRALLALLALLVCLVYVTHELGITPAFTAIQASLADVDDAMLRERSPIILAEPVVDTTQLARTMFRYQYLFARSSEHQAANNNNDITVVGKFAIVQADSGPQPCKVLILHPRQADAKAEVVLGPQQVMLLPRRWRYRLLAGKARVLQLCDLTSVVAAHVLH